MNANQNLRTAYKQLLIGLSWIHNSDFRFDVLERLMEASPHRVNLMLLIHQRMTLEGRSFRYYTGILQVMAEKKFIEVDINVLYNVEWWYNGTFDEFILWGTIKPEGIDEYNRLKKMDIDIRKAEVDLANSEYQLKHRKRTDLFTWMLLVGSAVTTFLALAKTFHLFGF